MTSTPPPADQRRSGILMLGVAAVFVAVAIFAAVAVSPWMLLVGLTAIPNVVAAVKAIRAPRAVHPSSGGAAVGRGDDPGPA